MEYILGLDGGGTKTDCYIFTRDGELAAYANGGATNHEKYDGGFDEMTPVFDEIVGGALSQLSIRPADLAASVYGMAGIDVPSQKTRMENYLAAKGFKNAIVVNDSFLGIKAGCPKGYGISFVNGTGNSVGGVDKDGKQLQVGGTGEYFGDLNGASGMSGAVVCAVYSMFYRCGPATSMAEKFFRLLGISAPEQFTEAIYDAVFTEKVSHKDIHNEVLYVAANEGDAVALDLLRAFGTQFAQSIGGCINNLRFDDCVDVVLIGSASLKARSPVMLDTCREKTEALTGKKINMIPLQNPPAAGALIWAAQLAFGDAQTDKIRDKIIAVTKK